MDDESDQQDFDGDECNIAHHIDENVVPISENGVVQQVQQYGQYDQRQS
jgi:hypothetical protein